MGGGLLYVANNAARLLHGSASSGNVVVRPSQWSGTPSYATRFPLSTRRSYPRQCGQNPAKFAGINRTRQVQASRIDIDFKNRPGPHRRPTTSSPPEMLPNVHTIYTKTPPEDTTVQGDQLFATLVDGETLSSLRGTGHTSFNTVTPSRG